MVDNSFTRLISINSFLIIFTRSPNCGAPRRSVLLASKVRVSFAPLIKHPITPDSLSRRRTKKKQENKISNIISTTFCSSLKYVSNKKNQLDQYLHTCYSPSWGSDYCSMVLAQHSLHKTVMRCSRDGKRSSQPLKNYTTNRFTI